MSPREQVLRDRIAENRRAIRRARQAEQRIERSLRESEQRTARAQAALREAGVLRD